MNRLLLTTCLLIIALNTCAQKPKPTLNEFGFLTGSWSFKTSKGKIAEIWRYKDVFSIECKSYKVALSGDSTLMENVLLTADAGEIYYIPVVKDQNNGLPVKFRLIAWDNQTYIFENKAHDFPQRIVYQLKSKNELLAWVEGVKNGQLKKSEYPYTRD